VGLGSAVLVGGLLVFLTGNPVSTLTGLWYYVTDEKPPIEDVTATAAPQGSVAAGFAVAGVLDGRPETAWATGWSDTGRPPDGCAPNGAAGQVVLRWQGDAEVRGIEVRAGLAAEQRDRAQQYRPRTLAVRYGEDGCTTVDLENEPGWQPRDLELDQEVDTLTVAVVAAYPPEATPGMELVAIQDLRVLARPR
jgi:hypothetical protein